MKRTFGVSLNLLSQGFSSKLYFHRVVHVEKCVDQYWANDAHLEFLYT